MIVYKNPSPCQAKNLQLGDIVLLPNVREDVMYDLNPFVYRLWSDVTTRKVVIVFQDSKGHRPAIRVKPDVYFQVRRAVFL